MICNVNRTKRTEKYSGQRSNGKTDRRDKNKTKRKKQRRKNSDRDRGGSRGGSEKSAPRRSGAAKSIIFQLAGRCGAARQSPITHFSRPGHPRAQPHQPVAPAADPAGTAAARQRPAPVTARTSKRPTASAEAHTSNHLRGQNITASVRPGSVHVSRYGCVCVLEIQRSTRSCSYFLTNLKMHVSSIQK